MKKKEFIPKPDQIDYSKARSIENLNHFRCKSCNKWWSIGDALKEKEEWWCPWCGKKDCYRIEVI